MLMRNKGKFNTRLQRSPQAIGRQWRVLTMKAFGEFLKTTAPGGLFVVLPVRLLYLLDTNLGEASRVLSHWGVGVGDLLGKG